MHYEHRADGDEVEMRAGLEAIDVSSLKSRKTIHKGLRDVARNSQWTDANPGGWDAEAFEDGAKQMRELQEIIAGVKKNDAVRGTTEDSIWDVVSDIDGCEADMSVEFREGENGPCGIEIRGRRGVGYARESPLYVKEVRRHRLVTMSSRGEIMSLRIKWTRRGTGKPRTLLDPVARACAAAARAVPDEENRKGWTTAEWQKHLSEIAGHEKLWVRVADQARLTLAADRVMRGDESDGAVDETAKAASVPKKLVTDERAGAERLKTSDASAVKLALVTVLDELKGEGKLLRQAWCWR